jgi:hypothetical protein
MLSFLSFTRGAGAAALLAIVALGGSARARADEDALWELSFALRDDDDSRAIAAATSLRDGTPSPLYRATFSCVALLLTDRAREAGDELTPSRAALRAQRARIDHTLQAARHCSFRAPEGPPALRARAPRFEGLSVELEATSARIDGALARPGLHTDVLADTSRTVVDTSPGAVDELLASAGVPGAAPWFPQTAVLFTPAAGAAFLAFLIDTLFLLAAPNSTTVPFATGLGLSFLGPVMLASALFAEPEIWLTVVASVAIALTGGALGVAAFADDEDTQWFAGGALIGVGVSLPILAIGIAGAANRASHDARIEEFVAREREAGTWR